ncbi:YbhN family protein [Asanoa sp. NPDC049518]|uniref:lysylphosphatidylglycerol synthase transmembrane domain-containing protein n=1 Tax=unclassified Asanoa TaxID=2685164 RepID=UPI0034440BFA
MPDAVVLSEERATRSWWSRSVRVIVAVGVVAGLAVLGLHGRLPTWADTRHAIATVDPRWILVAAALQAASLSAFSLQQHGLLSALGARLSRRHTVAIVLASTAMSISLPAGPAVSAAFAVRRYQRAGAPPEVAAAVMVISGLASIGGIVAVYVGAASWGGAGESFNWRPLIVVAVLVAVLAGVIGVGRRRWGRAPTRAEEAGRARRYALIALNWLRSTWHAATAVTATDWTVALLWSIAKWVTDLLCFLAVAQAFALPIGPATLTAVYLSVQVVRQVPLTPGGIGVVELALTAGLTAAGAVPASAAAAVLSYRVLSCWLIVPIGGLAGWFLVRSPRRPAEVN